MEYIDRLTGLNLRFNVEYPIDDIGVSRLFFDLHREMRRYVTEAKSWYAFNGRRWLKDSEGAKTMELCKKFVQGYQAYVKSVCSENEEKDKILLKFAKTLSGRKKREAILKDAQTIEPLSLGVFDRDPLAFNCKNGTLDLKTMTLRPHSQEDYITRLASVEYKEGASCERWERFIGEVMSGDTDTARFLQKALGCCLTGDTSLECFFIMYGSTTRNGKSTLSETVSHMLGDYACTVQPQTLSRRPSDGASASPDTARLKGARLVNMPEPEKGMTLNTALIKQLTGGDTYTARNLHESPIEFKPEFKIFINTNHLPCAADETVFASGRVKLIPFERHFELGEQDAGLKEFFRRPENKSGILNWLLGGYRLLKTEGLTISARMETALAEYRQDGGSLGYDFGEFLSETIIPAGGQKIKTSLLYGRYQVWAKNNGWRKMSSQDFVAELRNRYEVKRDGSIGNFIAGYVLKSETNLKQVS